MRIGLSTAPLAFRLRGAGGSAVDNPTEQGFHLRNPKTCPNKPGHLSRGAKLMGKLAKLKKKNKVRSYVAGLFDPQERLAKLSLLGDPLVELSRMIGWEAFRGDIDKARESAREHASTRATA